jgi:D-3-phosphoglycerate dehydrogenase / 2-oxoglutarate reductase
MNVSATPVTSFPKDKIKVVLLENIHPSAVELFSGEGFQVEMVKSALLGDELAEKIADAHVLGIRSKSQVTAEVLANARRLLSIGAFCIGTNQIDLGAANLRGVPVFNAPFSNTRSVAELVIGELIMLARHIPDRSRDAHQGRWFKTAEGSYEVRGKTIGIVGYGHIGAQVGVLAETLGMRVIFYDVMTKLPMGNNRPVGSLEELLTASDFVTLHVPATQQTDRMGGGDQIAQMKRGAYLLNLSRGNVVDIPALAAALKDGHVGGAAIDVFPEEPEGNGPGFESELRGLPNVILTPHIGGSTVEAQANIGTEVASTLIKFVNNGTTTGAVNFPQVELPTAPGAHRILNVHKNVPGVLRDINRIVSDLNATIERQYLSTDANIGYLVMDLGADVSEDVRKAVSALDANIRTRILY